MPSNPRMTSFWLNFALGAARRAGAGEREGGDDGDDQRQGLQGFGHEDAANYIVRPPPRVYNLRAWKPSCATSAWRSGGCAWRLASRCSRSLSLALGIGVSTAIYSAVRTLLWMPSGIADPGSLVSLTEPGRASGSISWPDFVDIRAQQSSFRSLAASQRLQIAAAIDGTAEAALGEAVSGDYFSTLGVTALHGRLLQPLDETAAARVVVVSESLLAHPTARRSARRGPDHQARRGAVRDRRCHERHVSRDAGLPAGLDLDSAGEHPGQGGRRRVRAGDRAIARSAPSTSGDG